MEAASKFSIPLLIIWLSTFLSGLVLTAYKTFPGKLFLKNCVEVLMDSGRMKYTGKYGFNVLTSSLTSVNFRISCVPLFVYTKGFIKNSTKKPYRFVI